MMVRTLLSLVTLIVLSIVLLAGCCCTPQMTVCRTSHAEPTNGASRRLPEGFVGSWTPIDSSAVFRIARSASGVEVDGWDSRDGEWFEISEVHWDGETLRFRSLMPSTNWAVMNVLMQGADGDGLIGLREGVEGRVRWDPWTEPPPEDSGP